MQTQQIYSAVLKHHAKCKKNNSIPRSKSIVQSAQTTRVFLVLPAKSTARNTQKIWTRNNVFEAFGVGGQGSNKIVFFFPLLAVFVKSADRLDGISIENATLWKEKDRMFYCSQKITKGNVNSVLIEGKIEYMIHETWEQKRALAIIREGKNHIFSTGPSSRVPLEYRVRALVSHLTSVALAGIRVAKILCWWKRDASKESSRKNI